MFKNITGDEALFGSICFLGTFSFHVYGNVMSVVGILNWTGGRAYVPTGITSPALAQNGETSSSKPRKIHKKKEGIVFATDKTVKK